MFYDKLLVKNCEDIINTNMVIVFLERMNTNRITFYFIKTRIKSCYRKGHTCI